MKRLDGRTGAAGAGACDAARHLEEPARPQAATVHERLRRHARRGLRGRVPGLHRHPGPGLHRIIAGTVGDVVVRPDTAGPATTRRSTQHPHRARLPGRRPGRGSGRGAGRRQRHELRHLRGRQGRQGDRRPRAPGIGLNYSTAPAGHGLEAPSRCGRLAEREGEIVLDPRPPPRPATGSATRCAGHRHRAAASAGAWWAWRGSARGHRRRDVVIVRHRHGAAAVPRRRGRVHRRLGDRRAGRPRRSCATGWPRRCPPGSRPSPATPRPPRRASGLDEALSFVTTFLLVFAGVALVVGAFLIVNTFSILVAQRSRELALLRAIGASRRQVTRSVLLEALAGRPRRDRRWVSGSASCWRSASRRCSRRSASTCPRARWCSSPRTALVVVSSSGCS